MNRNTKKIFKKLTKSSIKNKKKLLKIIQEYLITESDYLLPDLEYYASSLFDDNQQLHLIKIVGGEK